MELRELIAREGMILTNGEAYGKSITLGKNDNPDNWHEITEEEYETILTAELETDTVVEIGCDHQAAIDSKNTTEEAEV